MKLDPYTSSYWLKSSLETALRRDPVDAARDAEILATILRKRCDDILAREAAQPPAPTSAR
jgi:hypothetical protein